MPGADSSHGIMILLQLKQKHKQKDDTENAKVGSTSVLSVLIITSGTIYVYIL